MGNGRWQSVFICMKKEKLTFRSDLKGIPKLCCLPDSPFQHISGIPLKGLPSRFLHIADQSCYLALLWSPWENSKRVQIRIQDHVSLLDPGKAFNGRTVEHAAVIQSLSELADCDRHILHLSEHIRKLQPDKFHILILYQLHNIFLCIMLMHGSFLPPFLILNK